MNDLTAIEEVRRWAGEALATWPRPTLIHAVLRPDCSVLGYVLLTRDPVLVEILLEKQALAAGPTKADRLPDETTHPDRVEAVVSLFADSHADGQTRSGLLVTEEGVDFAAVATQSARVISACLGAIQAARRQAPRRHMN